MAQGSSIYLDKKLILSIMGTDHPEIMTTLAEILSRFKGVFLESHFNSLNHHFNGVFSIAIHHMYMKPFMACLASLTSEKIKFEFELLQDPKAALGEPTNINFDISMWGGSDGTALLEVLRLLNKNHLKVDTISEKAESCEPNNKRFSAQLSVSSDFVVDIEEVELELQQLAKELAIELVVLNDEQQMLEAV